MNSACFVYLLFTTLLILTSALVFLQLQQNSNKFSTSSSSRIVLSQNISLDSFPILENFLHCSKQQNLIISNNYSTPNDINVAFFGDSFVRGIFSNESRIYWNFVPEKGFAFQLVQKYYSSSSSSNDVITNTKDLFSQRIFATGSSGFVGDKVIKYEYSGEFRKAVRNFGNETSTSKLDLAFFMFGSNEAWKRNSNFSSQDISDAYSKFFEEFIFQKFNAKELVVITPPPVLPECPPLDICKLLDADVLESKVVAGIHNAVNRTSQKRNSIKLLDLFSYVNEKKKPKKWFGNDGVHFSFEGHEEIRKFVEREGCRPK